MEYDEAPNFMRHHNNSSPAHMLTSFPLSLFHLVDSTTDQIKSRGLYSDSI